jgi:hypothetical protein
LPAVSPEIPAPIIAIFLSVDFFIVGLSKQL